MSEEEVTEAFEPENIGKLKYNIEKVERHLQQIVKSSEELQRAHEDLYVKEQQWVLDMVDFNIHHGVKDGPLFALAQALKTLALAAHKMNKETYEQVTQPLKQFWQVDVCGSLEMQKKLEASRERYENASNKFANVSHRTEVGQFTKWENEVSESKHNYEIMYFSTLSKMMEIEQNKVRNVQETFYYFHKSLMSFFQEGLALMEALQPGMEELKVSLDEAKAKESSGEGTASKVRHLQQSLSMSEVMVANGLPETPQWVSKQGYLFRKSAKAGKGWKCMWFVLDIEGVLHWWKNQKDEDEEGSISLLLCTVKEALTEKSYCFEIISPDSRLTLRATNETEYNEWIELLRDAIATQLAGNKGNVNKSQGTSVMEQLWKIPGNSECADCRAKDPDWASLNLGILICVKCSGIHRSLGVHISKVRSLGLDKWEPQQLGLMKSIGNAQSNTIWESYVPPEHEASRPNADSDPRIKENWIKAKYNDKAFVAKKPPHCTPDELGPQLWFAALTGNYVEVLRCIAWGSSVNWVDNEEEGRTALHSLPAAGGDVICMELILQNGGEVNMLDHRGRTPLHYSAECNKSECCRILQAKGSLSVEDNEGMTPLHIAIQRGYTKCIRVLEGFEKQDQEQNKRRSLSLAMEKNLNDKAKRKSGSAMKKKLNLAATTTSITYDAGKASPRLLDKIKGVTRKKKASTVSVGTPTKNPLPLSKTNPLLNLTLSNDPTLSPKSPSSDSDGESETKVRSNPVFGSPRTPPSSPSSGQARAGGSLIVSRSGVRKDSDDSPPSEKKQKYRSTSWGKQEMSSSSLSPSSSSLTAKKKKRESHSFTSPSTTTTTTLTTLTTTTTSSDASPFPSPSSLPPNFNSNSSSEEQKTTWVSVGGYGSLVEDKGSSTKPNRPTTSPPTRPPVRPQSGGFSRTPVGTRTKAPLALAATRKRTITSDNPLAFSAPVHNINGSPPNNNNNNNSNNGDSGGVNTSGDSACSATEDNSDSSSDSSSEPEAEVVKKKERKKKRSSGRKSK